jgi:hypothetical protein
VTFTQERLYTELTRRIRIAQSWRDRSQARFESPLGNSDLSIIDAAARVSPDVAAVVVMRAFDPAAFAQSALAFAVALPESWRDQWLGAYTRTIFLAGNPANLGARFPFQHVADDASHAWLGPAPPQVALTLRRLLVSFKGDSALRLPNQFSVTVPLPAEARSVETPFARRIYIGIAGLSTLDYLVHLNHTLAEATLLGLIAPGNVVTIRHVPRLHSCQEKLIWLRVHRDSNDANRLRAYAGVSELEPAPSSCMPID